MSSTEDIFKAISRLRRLERKRDVINAEIEKLRIFIKENS